MNVAVEWLPPVLGSDSGIISDYMFNAVRALPQSFQAKCLNRTATWIMTASFHVLPGFIIQSSSYHSALV